MLVARRAGRAGREGHSVSWLAPAKRRGASTASPSLSELMLLDVAPPAHDTTTQNYHI